MTISSVTKARGRVRAWKVVGAFCARRGGDYAKLIPLELADTKAKLLREVIAMVALAIGLSLEVAPFVRTVFSIFKWNAGWSRCRFNRGQHREVSFIRGLVPLLLWFALVASAFGTPYFIGVVWGVAGTWIAVSVAASFVLRAQLRGASHFPGLRSELRKDAQVIKEVL